MTSSSLGARSVSSARCWSNVGWMKPRLAARLSSQSGRWRCNADGSSLSLSACGSVDEEEDEEEDAEYRSVNVSAIKFPSPHVSYDDEAGDDDVVVDAWINVEEMTGWR